MAVEVWENVKGYVGYYQVSTLGRVRGLQRTVQVKSRWGTITTRTYPARTLIPTDVGGRLAVWLHKGGSSKLCSVHHLVLEAFVKPRPSPKMEGCHEDGDYRNNRADNLRWDSHKGNHQDRIKHGTNCAGEANGRAKLTDELVVKARKLYSTGKYLITEVAAELGIRTETLGPAIKGRSWKHVKYRPGTDFGRGIARLKAMGRW